MAFIANQEDIPSSLDPLRDSPFKGCFYSTNESPQNPSLKTPINPLFPLDLSTHLTPALDALGINFQTSSSHHSQNNIQFPENINPQHRSIIEGMLKTNWSPGDLEGQEASIIMDHNGVPSGSPPPLASSTPVRVSILNPDETVGSEEADVSVRGDDDNRSVTFDHSGFGPEDTTDLEIESKRLLLPLVPTTPTLGIRRAVTRAQSTLKKIPQTEAVKAFPQTEPRRPVKGILKTPIVPGSASGLRNKGGKSTEKSHRSWGWYDSTSFSPLPSMDTPPKKNNNKAGKKGGGKGKKVKIDEVVDERILSSEEGEDVQEEGSPENCYIGGISSDESEATPSKKPKGAKGKDAGKKSKKEQESSSDEEEEEEPIPKKQGKKQTGRPANRKKKQKGEDEEAFKPSKGSSDVEEEYETSKPKGGRQYAKGKEAVDNNEEAEQEEEEEEEETGQGSDNEGAGEEESESGSGEGGNNKAGSGSDEEEDNGSSQSNNQSESEEEGEEEEEEESDEEFRPQYAESALRMMGTKTNTDSSKSSISKPRSSKSNDRSLMKRMSVENQRAKLGPDGQSGLRKAQADKAFERQEQFKRDGSLREIKFTGILGERNDPPPILLAANSNRDPYTSFGGAWKEPTKLNNKADGWPHVIEALKLTDPNKPQNTPSDDGNNAKEDGKETEERIETAFPITQGELNHTVKYLDASSKALKDALEKGKKYQRRHRRAIKKIATLRHRIKELERNLAQAGSEYAELELELAAKNAIGYDPMSYCYTNPEPEPELDSNFHMGFHDPLILRKNPNNRYPTLLELKEIGGAPLEVQRFEYKPFSTVLRNNPYREEDMYRRREIINGLTFPANVMLLDHSTYYFFVCCFCSKVSPAKLLFFQDELVWSSHRCLLCDAHVCCKNCKRWTAPVPPDQLPDAHKLAELLNGHKGKGNYEASLYLRGVWWDYNLQAQKLKLLRGGRSDHGLDYTALIYGIQSEGSVFPPQLGHERGYDFSAIEGANEKGANAQGGLRSMGKRRIEYEEEDEVHEGKRRKVEEILEKRRRARQLPFPETTEDDYDEQGYEDDEADMVVEEDNR
ncbi:hypothetical protein TWF506_000931 [Arthrobotrys conoides]|uniref:Uncharacterized protein n=1 Tax=Arthrobotrys conoides TaxID=74498 RepID=A0AAN8RQX2_9PEZI